jgi:hypothetical protein
MRALLWSAVAGVLTIGALTFAPAPAQAAHPHPRAHYTVYRTWHREVVRYPHVYYRGCYYRR